MIFFPPLSRQGFFFLSPVSCSPPVQACLECVPFRYFPFQVPPPFSCHPFSPPNNCHPVSFKPPPQGLVATWTIQAWAIEFKPCPKPPCLLLFSVWLPPFLAPKYLSPFCFPLCGRLPFVSLFSPFPPFKAPVFPPRTVHACSLPPLSTSKLKDAGRFFRHSALPSLCPLYSLPHWSQFFFHFFLCQLPPPEKTLGFDPL